MNGSACMVTGGAGAIGSHLVQALLGLGAEVDVIDDLSSGRRENLPGGGRVHLFELDITGPECKRVLSSGKYRYVFHLAAHYANTLSIDEPGRDLEVNLLGTLNLLEALAVKPAERFIFASSSCVYGAQGCADESLPLRPSDLDTPYALGKFSAEALIDFWARHYGLKAVILRYFNSYGPRDWPGPSRGVIPNFLAQAMAGEPLQIYGSGEEIRDFTFVGDIVAATIMAAVQEEACGKTLNVGSGRGTTLRELADTINTITGNQAGLVCLPARAWDRCRVRVANLGNSSRLLGLLDPTPLERGLTETWFWAKTISDGLGGISRGAGQDGIGKQRPGMKPGLRVIKRHPAQ